MDRQAQVGVGYDFDNAARGQVAWSALHAPWVPSSPILKSSHNACYLAT